MHPRLANRVSGRPLTESPPMPQRIPKLRLSDEALRLVAARFKTLSEPTRLKLLMALEERECHVTELVQATRATQTNVSRQLRILTEAGILARTKRGVSVFYRIADPAIFDLCRHVCGSLEKQLAEQGTASTWFRA